MMDMRPACLLLGLRGALLDRFFSHLGEICEIVARGSAIECGECQFSGAQLWSLGANGNPRSPTIFAEELQWRT